MTRWAVQIAVALLLSLPMSLLAGQPADQDVIDTVEASIEVGLLENQSPFKINLAIDLPIIVSGMLVVGAPVYMGIDLDRDMRYLDPGQLNRIDRSVLGNWSTNAGAVSDGLLMTQVALPFLLNFIDVMGSESSDGLSGFGKDSLILLETLAVNCMAFNLTKFTVRRPRPYAYDPQHGLAEDDTYNASLSFFSGHASLVFSMATSYSYLFSKRHPDSPLVVPIWIGAHTLAAATAGLRVRAGKHFWSDVVTGAAVGSLIGFLVPFLHTREGPEDDLTGNLMVTPMFFEGGFGSSATWLF